ncbi:hypothetical protein LTR46_004705 [Exophiala xenobiotica]|nr:hypothetical protein LTR46_004705 [Exophiala xenobiotica]
MAPSLQPNLFITYSSPSEFRNQGNRQAVSSFASRSYRLTSKKITLDRNNYRPFAFSQHGPASPSLTPKTKAKRKQPPTKSRASASPISPQELIIPRSSHPLDECALGSPSVDPFTTYPISFKPYVPFLIDYFIRFLTPRFSPALAVETSRYLMWFNVALHNPELFHALIALSQVYYNIDVNGFGTIHWTALYHRGEALKQLRVKVEHETFADDDAAILTALWLMDVDTAQGDLQAFRCTKKQRKEWSLQEAESGISGQSCKTSYSSQSEFFLPLLLHGRFVCEVTKDNDVLVRFKQNEPVQTSRVGSFPGFFSVLASKGLLTTQVVGILQRIYKQISREPRFVRAGSVKVTDPVPRPPQVDHDYSEMSRVLHITDEVQPTLLNHRVLLALLVYIFNLHNPPQRPAPWSTSTKTGKTGSSRRSYLEILSNVALELCRPSEPANLDFVTEREVTLWTMVAIGSASSFSPWRLEIPFMGHLIEWMEDDDDDKEEEEDGQQEDDTLTMTRETGSCQPAHSATSTPSNTGRRKGTNLENLTACLRGYYLYGADKETLRSLQTWRSPDKQIP